MADRKLLANCNLASLRSLISLIFVVLYADTTNAFEQETHAEITKASVVLSQLTAANGRITQSLGIPRGRIEQSDDDLECPLSLSLGLRNRSRIYYDGPRRARVACRSVFFPWDFKKMNLPVSLWIGSPEQWILVGVTREDDVKSITPLLFSDDPDWIFPQILNNQDYRVFNHFFDPVHNIGLTVGGSSFPVRLKLGEPSINWALGHDPSNPRSNPDPNFPNQFTIPDMFEAFFRAVTGATIRSGNLVNVASTQLTRNRWLASAFRSMGDLLHLNQDMGQPQHSRNDPHSGAAPWAFPVSLPLAGHASILEGYFNARVLGDPSKVTNLRPFTLPCLPPNLTSLPLNISLVPLPTFSKYAHYWTTSPNRDDFRGNGLADYTNRGFFTHGKNLGSNDFNKPNNDPKAYAVTTETILPGCAKAAGRVGLVLNGTVVDERLGQAATGVPLTTTFSLINYQLTRKVYDRMASLVIPRTVAYSAGLIDHVLRAKLEISLPPQGVYALIDQSTTNGFAELRVNIKNATSPISNPEGVQTLQHFQGGTLVAVVRFHRNDCYKADRSGDYGAPNVDWRKCRRGGSSISDLEQEIVVSKPKQGFALSAGDTAESVLFDFSANPIPLDASDLYLQIVYRGPIGVVEDDAIAVGSRDISEPTYMIAMNFLDYIRVRGKYYTRDEVRNNKDGTLDELRARRPECIPLINFLLSCFPEQTASSDFVFGHDPRGAVVSFTLPIRRYLSVALLGDEQFEVEQKKSAGSQGFPRVLVATEKHQWSDPSATSATADDYSNSKLINWRGVLLHRAALSGFRYAIDSVAAEENAYLAMTKLPDLTAISVSIRQ